ncbi:unnamed protein product, partial [marine sediment metagenome]
NIRFRFCSETGKETIEYTHTYRKALVISDYQNDGCCDGGPGGHECSKFGCD